MKDNPKVESNQDGTEEASTLEVLVSLPDKKIQVRKSFEVLGFILTAAINSKKLSSLDWAQ